jgi:spore coat polysaccharide biosynthesis predicted glycosyltransferase SpsG
LITYGGVDPSNLTLKTLDAVYNFCEINNIEINIITGSGYKDHLLLEKYNHAVVHKNIQNISEFMFNSDIVFTSAGRTVYEIASIGTPAIVLAQNEREMTHFFASKEYGFVNLGLGSLSNKDNILKSFIELTHNYRMRMENSILMKKQNLKLGRKRVNNLITQAIEKI